MGCFGTGSAAPADDQAWDEIAAAVRACADAHADAARITIQSLFSEWMSMEVNEASAVISAARGQLAVLVARSIA
jgi:hypothetical protein